MKRRIGAGDVADVIRRWNEMMGERDLKAHIDAHVKFMQIERQYESIGGTSNE